MQGAGKLYLAKLIDPFSLMNRKGGTLLSYDIYADDKDQAQNMLKQRKTDALPQSGGGKLDEHTNNGVLKRSDDIGLLKIKSTKKSTKKKSTKSKKKKHTSPSVDSKYAKSSQA